ncbi:MAG: VOC family protein [Anaerolineae bacterium]
MRRFTGVCLITAHVPRLTAFYRSVLEIEPEGGDVHAAFATPGGELAIYSIDGTEAMAPGATEGMGTGGLTLGFQVEDVDAEYARLLALGVPIVKPPATYPWGARSVWFRDPDGNLVDYYTRVK